MADDTLPWQVQLAYGVSGFVPIGWLVFKFSLRLCGRLQANVDMEKPVPLPLALQIVGAIITFPLFYLPGWDEWLKARVGDNYVLVIQLGLNALFWEFLLRKIVTRRLANALFLLDALAELRWGESGLFGAFGF